MRTTGMVFCVAPQYRKKQNRIHSYVHWMFYAAYH